MDGKFVETQTPLSSSTGVAIDINNGLIIIAEKRRLAQQTKHIARMFCRLIETIPDINMEFNVSVEAVNDPVDFLAILSDAVSIKRFDFTVHLPNHAFRPGTWQAATQSALNKLQAEQAKVAFSGEGLDPQECVELAVALNAEGEQVRAKVVTPNTPTPRNISMRNKKLRLTNTTLDSKGDAEVIMPVVEKHFLEITTPPPSIPQPPLTGG
jgi:hypothetical protein